MYIRHEVGKIGEDLSVQYLEKNNYKIIERNFKCIQGEIDIICRDKDELVFIEVKTRTNKQFGNPVEAVNNIKRKHIYKSAQYYLYVNKLEKEFVRIDIIEAYLSNKKCMINHIKNAGI